MRLFWTEFGLFWTEFGLFWSILPGLFEVQANPKHNWKSEFPGVTIKGGVLMSGGTYQCYSDPNDPRYPAQPIGSCKGCTNYNINANLFLNFRLKIQKEWGISPEK